MMDFEILSLRDFDAFYALLCEAFPPNERRSEKEQRSLFLSEYYRVFAKRFGRQLVCLALWDFGNFRFIEHFAAEASLRGKGIGSSFLQEIVQLSSSPCVLEAEPPVTEIQKRRIAFYKRNGFFLHSFDYFQPPLNPGDEKTPLCIMASEPLTEEQFGQMREMIYRTVYHFSLPEFPGSAVDSN